MSDCIVRAFLLFFLGLLIGACTTVAPASATPQRDPTVSAALLESKTVALAAYAQDGMAIYCAGVWVSSTAILTANHCVDQLERGAEVDYLVASDIGIARTTLHYARLSDSDEGHDLALLKTVGSPGHGSASLLIGPIESGMPTQGMGHPLGLPYSYSSGVVSAVRKWDVNGLDLFWIQTTAPVSPGNSGGGLFDEDGYLIGICHGSYTMGQNLNVFVHRDYIREFLAGKL